MIKYIIVFLCLSFSTFVFSLPQAEVYTKEWDLGKVDSDSKIEKVFKIKNIGNDQLKIEKIINKCTCITVKIIDKEAQKDKYISFSIILDPANIPPGKILKYIYVKLNDPQLSTYRIAIRGQRETTNNALRHRINSLSLPIVIGTGLIDGINPCAFVTIIFLISFLTVSAKSRYFILKTGLLYSLGIFIVYFMLGVGILKGIRWLNYIESYSNFFQYISIILLFVMAIINIIDALNYLVIKDTSNIILKLPIRLHQLIHRVIRANIKSRYFLFSTFIAGVLIALLESVCTGQTYIPCLIYMGKVGTIIKLKSIILILIYNLMFIVPLIIVVLLTIGGLKIEKLLQFSKRNMVFSKIILSIIFIIMGIFLLILK